MSLTVGVSFDLLGSLITVHPSCGYQYAVEMERFLRGKGVQQTNLNIDVLNANYALALKLELTGDRAKWVSEGLGEAKMMPIGGKTRESVLNFWSRVLQRLFDDNGAFCNYDERVMSILQESAGSPEWSEFSKSVVDRFATPEPYCWLPEALPTLSALHEWSENKRSRGVHCTPPCILTNSDCRLLSVLSDMLKRDSNKPLVGSLFTASMVGLGKPSAEGIFLACKTCGVTSVQNWVHVGDTEDDRLAAERAGCHFLHCSPTVGPVWAKLREILEKLCGEVENPDTVLAQHGQQQQR